MRFRLSLTPNSELVPFTHLPSLVRTVHRWLGQDNPVHDGMSLYSVGWLLGGKAGPEGLEFPEGATWDIGFLDPEMAKRLVAGVVSGPEVFAGMAVTEARLITPPSFEGEARMVPSSPILVRTQTPGGGKRYLEWSDPKADETLTRSVQGRLRAAGLDGPDAEIKASFDRTDPRARTKLVTYKRIRHMGNMCAVRFEGAPIAHKVLWTVGVGSLTGSGFGALR